MLHLHTERLAALGGDVPTPDEAAHLAMCDDCARERGAYLALVAMAYAEREPFGLPLTRWESIAAELRADHALDVVPLPGRRSGERRMLQIAAGLLLVAGGAIAGRVSANVRPSANTSSVAGIASRANASSSGIPAADSTTFASVNEARNAQQRAELDYQQAAAFLAKFDTSGTANGSPVAVRSRLVALDQMISTWHEAMRQAPHDPVINGYYLTALGQREATLRQLNSALPASLRVNSF